MLVQLAHGKPGQRRRVVRLERKRAFEMGARRHFPVPRVLVQAVPPAQQTVVDSHVLGLLGFGMAAAGVLDAPGHGGRDPVGDLVLHREDIVQVAVVALGPQLAAARHLRQLRRHPHPVPTSVYAALDQVAHAQPAPGEIGGLAAVARLECRLEPDHE